jgi:hypothetical protein
MQFGEQDNQRAKQKWRETKREGSMEMNDIFPSVNLSKQAA